MAMSSWARGLVVIVACALLIGLLKGPGIVVAAAVIVLAARWPVAAGRDEVCDRLRASLMVALTDISDVVDRYEHFALSSDADALADRTLRLPELLNPDSAVPEISNFHHSMASARSFRQRMEAYVAVPGLSAATLGRYVSIAAERAEELSQAWLAAREAARRHAGG